MLGHQKCRVMGAILLSMGTLMANECRSNPQCRIHFLVLTLLFYLIYLPQTTSIRSIGASFGAAPRCRFGGRSPMDTVSTAGSQLSLLSQPRLTKSNWGCSANYLKLGWILEVFSDLAWVSNRVIFFFSLNSVVAAKLLQSPVDLLWPQNGAWVSLFSFVAAGRICAVPCVQGGSTPQQVERVMQ